VKQLIKKDILTFGILIAVIIFLPIKQTHSQPAGSPHENSKADSSPATNEDLQANFYRELTKKLTEPTPSPSSPQPKTLKQSVSENPALLLTLIGALIAALVAFVSFVFNYRTTLRIQTDTQFYEALKRFGDKDSPSIRSSAAGLLGQMGEKRIGMRRKQQYLPTSLSQLVTGLLLEDNAAVTISIGDSLGQLVPHDPSQAANRLYVANMKLQEDMVRLLADYFFVNGFRPSEEAIESLQLLDNNVWRKVESITSYHKDLIIELIRTHLDKFVTSLEDHVAEVKEQDKLLLQDKLATLSQRLLINTKNFALAFVAQPHKEPSIRRGLLRPAMEMTIWLLRTRNRRGLISIFLRKKSEIRNAIDEFNQARERTRKKRIDEIVAQFFKRYDKVYLPASQLRHSNLKYLILEEANLQRADLSRARLRRVNLVGANLKNADFSFAELSGVSFYEASLEGAIFTNASITNVFFYGAKIDATTVFDGFEWWKANFLAEDSELDVDLLRTLFQCYGASVPENLKDVHPATRDYLLQLKSENQDQPTKTMPR